MAMINSPHMISDYSDDRDDDDDEFDSAASDDDALLGYGCRLYWKPLEDELQ